MKKGFVIIIVIISFVLLIVGFVSLHSNENMEKHPTENESKNNNTSTEKKEKSKIEEMEDQLRKYGEATFQTSGWSKGKVEKGAYFLALETLEQNMEISNSIFVNPDTSIPCDRENTGVEIIIKNDSLTEYEIVPILSCGLENEIDAKEKTLEDDMKIKGMTPSALD